MNLMDDHIEYPMISDDIAAAARLNSAYYFKQLIETAVMPYILITQGP